jgi:hypothetical protein
MVRCSFTQPSHVALKFTTLVYSTLYFSAEILWSPHLSVPGLCLKECLWILSSRWVDPAAYWRFPDIHKLEVLRPCSLEVLWPHHLKVFRPCLLKVFWPFLSRCSNLATYWRSSDLTNLKVLWPCSLEVLLHLLQKCSDLAAYWKFSALRNSSCCGLAH